MAYCSNCGKNFEDGMEFCPDCGAKLLEGEIDESITDGVESKEWYEIDIFHLAVSPIVRSFDNGNFFRIIAKGIIDILAFGFLISQPLDAYDTMTSKLFCRLSNEDKTAYLIFSILMLLLAIFSFGYWMKRIRRIDNVFKKDDDFVVIPLGTYLFQWIGEWLALILGIGGLFGIIVSLCEINTTSFILSMITYFGFQGGIYAIVLAIIVVFVFRVIAEKFRAVAAIANNTKQSNDATNLSETSMEEGSDLYFNILYAICILCTVGFILVAMFK